MSCFYEINICYLFAFRNEAGSGTAQTGGVDGLKISMDNHVYRIEFNRPKKFNALTFDMYNGIVKALEEASANQDVKFVVFSGN